MSVYVSVSVLTIPNYIASISSEYVCIHTIWHHTIIYYVACIKSTGTPIIVVFLGFFDTVKTFVGIVFTLHIAWGWHPVNTSSYCCH